MTDYITDLPKMADYLFHLSKDDRHNWLANYIFKGYTAPLFLISPEQSASSIINQLYNLSDSVGQSRLCESIKMAYNSMSGFDIKSSGFIDILECIALLNVTEVVPDLYSIAAKGSLKNQSCSVIPEYLDIHTYILKTLFGLPHEKHEKRSIELLAKRDIFESKYMLECFHFLMYSPKFSTLCGKYVPLLLSEVQSTARDYASAIVKYLKMMGDDELINRISSITKLLVLNNDNLIPTFQRILYENEIQLVENDGGDVNKIILVRETNKMDIPSNFVVFFVLLFVNQLNQAMSNDALQAYNGNGRQHIIDLLH